MLYVITSADFVDKFFLASGDIAIPESAYKRFDYINTVGLAKDADQRQCKTSIPVKSVVVSSPNMIPGSTPVLSEDDTFR